ncbi:MAG: beta-lactamase family protein [bacterium]|nr:beta-lactamase family protein [bacterium]
MSLLHNLRPASEPFVAIDGFLHPNFGPVADRLREQLDGSVGGAAVCIYHRGHCVVDLWGGVRDAAGQPWLKETMSPSFSTTKGVASTLLHIMVDRGLLDYDDRVAKHWPEFAAAGKAEITVRQILSHQSGLYHIREMIDRADRMLDWEHMITAIEETEPIHTPGERTGYHGLTYGYLVGEILQRVTGRAFSDLVKEELATPLGLDGMFIGTPEEELSRAAELIWPRSSVGPRWIGQSMVRQGMTAAAPLVEIGARLAGIQVDLRSILDSLAPRGIDDFDFGAEETLRASIPAANGLFTARSLARMYAALAGGGQIGGTRILSKKALLRATRVQTKVAHRVVIPFDMQWRLGYHGVFTTRGTPRHAFGHFGFGGSGAWADPSRDLAVGLIVNSGLGTPFGDMRIARISAAALESADRGRAVRRAGVAGRKPTSVPGEEPAHSRA